jgi:hypothetical protein
MTINPAQYVLQVWLGGLFRYLKRILRRKPE